MAGKRASMREGPLAALFRRTDEESPEERRDDQQADQRAEDSRVREPEPRESLRPDYAQQSIEPAPEQPHRVPSPKERLSAAFAHGSAAHRCTSPCSVSQASAVRV